MSEEFDSFETSKKFSKLQISLDDLITRVGEGVAKAQEVMDRSQIQGLRRILKSIGENGINPANIVSFNSYTIPETTASFKLVMSYDLSGDHPNLLGMPVNAEVVNKTDIDIEASSEVNIKFVNIPEKRPISSPPETNYSEEDIYDIVNSDDDISGYLNTKDISEINLHYSEDDKLWLVSFLSGDDPELVVFVEDESAEILVKIARLEKMEDIELEPIKRPYFDTAEPSMARHGDIITIKGENFLTLGNQTQLFVDDNSKPYVKLSNSEIQFKLTDDIVRGDIEIITPAGSTRNEDYPEAGLNAFTPVAVMHSFSPSVGHFNEDKKTGSIITIYGHNFDENVKIMFSPKQVVPKGKMTIISPNELKVEVPSDATSGPITLLSHGKKDISDKIFFIQPHIEKVSPRQAFVGDRIKIIGNTLEIVTHLIMGDTVISKDSFVIQNSSEIQFDLPDQATDGTIVLREEIDTDRYNEVSTKDIFFVIPTLSAFSPPETDFERHAVLQNQIITLYGEGLDIDSNMMSVIFNAHKTIPEVGIHTDVLTVADDRKSLTVRTPSDATTDFVRLIRKRIYNPSKSSETSSLSKNKLTVLSESASPSDLIFIDRFEGELVKWQQTKGDWKIVDGLLMSIGDSKIRMQTAHLKNVLPLESVSVFADILNAEEFGIALHSVTGTILQCKINLTLTQPVVKWIQITGNTENTISQKQISLSKHNNYFLNLSCGSPGANSDDIGNTFEIYSSAISYGIFIDEETSQSNINFIGFYEDQRINSVVYSIIEQASKYLLWGYHSSINDFTGFGQQLFIKIVAYHSKRNSVQEKKSVIYVNGKDSDETQMIKELLEANNFDFNQVSISDINKKKFKNGDLVIIASSSGENDRWGDNDPKKIEVIDQTDLPILGMGKGGLAFFDNIVFDNSKLNIGYSNSVLGETNFVTLSDEAMKTLSYSQSEEGDANGSEKKVELFINQMLIDTITWNENKIQEVEIIGNSQGQRWDNILLMTGPYLSSPSPENYQFADIPKRIVKSKLQVYQIKKIPNENKVELTGSGFTDDTEFFVGGIKAVVVNITDNKAVIEIPQDATSGSIEVKSKRGDSIASKDMKIELEPQILDVVPSKAKLGEFVKLVGTNFPTDKNAVEIYFKGQKVQIKDIINNLITIVCPKILGTDQLEVRYKEYTIQSKKSLTVYKESIVVDLIELARHRNTIWSTKYNRRIQFGVTSDKTSAKVTYQFNIKLEDDRLYQKVLNVHPPSPREFGLIGQYPQFTFPDSNLEFRLKIGMMKAALRTLFSRNTAKADGVIVEVLFRERNVRGLVTILEPKICIYDQKIDEYNIGCNNLAGKTGHLIIRIKPGRNGYQDNAGIIEAAIYDLG